MLIKKLLIIRTSNRHFGASNAHVTGP